ncbi:MAG TPA: hypothetical protein VFI09_01055 [Solirubrobacterales bacterium]|nr:hypothetical protein [Solirubrobacterales bacterium]
MRGKLGTLAAIALVTLAVAPLAHGEEQTRESYKAQVEPICRANRKTNEKIMAGAQQRINENKLKPAGRQFVRLSRSFGDLVGGLTKVSPPATDVHRIDRWIEIMKLLKGRLRLAGKYYVEGNKIKGTHMAIWAQRAALSANNTTIVLHFHYCRFGNFEHSG